MTPPCGVGEAWRVRGCVLCQRPLASRRNLGAHEHGGISSRHEPFIVSPPTARVTRLPKDGGQHRLG